MAGCKPAESLLAEREQERECGAGVSQNAGLERVDTRVLRFYWLLCCCVGSALGATCCWLPLLHLMEARLEFISPAAGCIIALALTSSVPVVQLASFSDVCYSKAVVTLHAKYAAGTSSIFLLNMENSLLSTPNFLQTVTNWSIDKYTIVSFKK